MLRFLFKNYLLEIHNFLPPKNTALNIDWSYKQKCIRPSVKLSDILNWEMRINVSYNLFTKFTNMSFSAAEHTVTPTQVQNSFFVKKYAKRRLLREKN
jgi:hypothetical protein